MESARDETSTEEALRRCLRDARLNRSKALQAILEALCAEPDRRFRAIDFVLELGILPGSVYPILRKLERQGYIETEADGLPISASVLTYRLTKGGALFVARYLSVLRPPTYRSGIRVLVGRSLG
jgi:DNA-binding PadR family transcriptional regulator